jgi:hypothetical protein
MARVGLFAVCCALVVAAVAGASAPPVGPLPKGPVQSIQTTRGSLVSVALPHRTGFVWRLAKPVSSKLLVEVGEADVGSNVVVVFRARSAGRATVAYGLTRGETRKAHESRTFLVRIAG